MKVAIIGAGVSGLACAHELERHGIYPTVFERKSFIGDIESHVTANINLMNRPVNNWIGYIEKKFSLKVNPIAPINSIVHKAPNKTTTVKGNLGYLINRSKDKESLIVQLYSQLRKPNIIFNEYGDYEKILKKFDCVVIATGDPGYANELGCWQQRLTGWIRVAVVLGNFNPNEIIMWINNDYSNKGYAYLTPFNKNKASLALFVPYISENELDYYWELFLNTENIKFDMVEESKVLHHSGMVYPHSLRNIYFVGAAGGALDPFLGFGQVDAIMQGIYAAQAIACGRDYGKLLKSLDKKINDLWEFRKLYDKATNNDYNIILSLMGIPGIKQSIYELPVNVFKIGADFIRLRNEKN